MSVARGKGIPGRTLVLIAALGLGAVAFVTPPSHAAGRAARRAPPDIAAVDWPTFGYDQFRTGYNPNEAVIGVSNAPGLHLLWSVNLGAPITNSAVEAAGVTVDGVLTDVLYVGAENGRLYALNADTGALVWKRFIGSRQTVCGDLPDGLFGVTGSPTIDRARGFLYAAGGNGLVYALDLATGATAAGWPVRITADPAHEHVYGGLTFADPNLYATLASYCDITPYHGRIVRIDASSGTKVGVFRPAGKTVYGGGIWGPGGVSVDPATGDVFVATGNALTTPENFRYSEDVVELSSSLHVLGANYPGLTGGDADFGATPILYQAPGCPAQVAAKNKYGAFVVYSRGAVGSGYTQRLQIADVNDGQFNGIPAYSPVTNMVYVSNSSDSSAGTFLHGLVALRVGELCDLSLAWQDQQGPNPGSLSPPSVANGVVYYGSGNIYEVWAFDAATGAPLWNSGSTIHGQVFGQPIVVNGKLYAGSWDHYVYAFGP